MFFKKPKMTDYFENQRVSNFAADPLLMMGFVLVI